MKILFFILTLILCSPIYSTTNNSKSSGLKREPNQSKILPLSERMKTLVQKHTSFILNWTFQPEAIQQLKESNLKKLPMETIKRIDERWQNNQEVKLKEELQNNEVGKFLKSKIVANDFYSEAFLCNQQGLVVGEYPVTSDYWQGDEEKFTMSYRDGIGAIFYNPLTYDDSSKLYTVQISIPVKDWNETIGVLVVGLKNKFND